MRASLFLILLMSAGVGAQGLQGNYVLNILTYRDNGARRALIPIENKRQFLEVNADALEYVDPSFYGDLPYLRTLYPRTTNEGLDWVAQCLRTWSSDRAAS